MADITKHIGLSLGADLCWPICYEQIMEQLDLQIPWEGNQVRFDVQRVTIEPYDLRQNCRFDLVIDRVTHWYHTSREWIKKSILVDGLYTYNNPWSIQSMEKQTTYCAMARLGLPIPETWMVPPKAYESHDDLDTTLNRYARLFDLGEVGEKLGYPMYMKPYDGGAWKGVSRIENTEQLKDTYDDSGTFLMHLQKSVEGFDRFVRCIGLGPQFQLVSYDPAAPLHDRYQVETDFLTPEDASLLRDIGITINAFFGWDFNSCESLHCRGTWHPIDFANACPDSQVTSLHYFFPWIVLANIRWSVFCATTGKKMKMNLDWQPYYEIADSDRSYREKLAAYAEIGHREMQSEAFAQFCDDHLSDLDSIALEYFQSDSARQAVRGKVQALFPEHEVDTFTELFWERIQHWRNDQIASAV